MTKRKLAQDICKIEGGKINLPLSQVMEVLTKIEILEGKLRAQFMKDTGILTADDTLGPALISLHQGATKVALKEFKKLSAKKK